MRFFPSLILLAALTLALAACTGGSAAPRFEPPADAEEAIAQAREAVEDVESYRYTVTTTFAAQGHERAIHGEGAWAASNFILETDVHGSFHLNGPQRPFEYVSVDGSLFEREVGSDGPWRDISWAASLLAGPPSSLVVNADEWELVMRGPADEEGVHHLSGTRVHEPQPLLDPDGQDTGETFQADYTHDLFLSAETMLPVRRETRVLNQRIGIDGEMAEWTQTSSYEFSDFNAPVTIALPEPREELPDPDATPAPPSTPTPHSVSP